MRSHSYLNSAKAIISAYDGVLPLSAWLKNYFRGQKKFGSTDRKNITHLCYCYYRIGKAYQQMNYEDRMLNALFLCSEKENLVLSELRPEWIEHLHRPLVEKLEIVGLPDHKNLFPLSSFLSKEIDASAFAFSHLLQPSFFLRIRPGKKEKLIQVLAANAIWYEMAGDHCLRLRNGEKIEELIHLNSDAVVQDLNSQQVFNQLLRELHNHPPGSFWDCCAASGGKSILFHDLFPSARIMVTDVRESILINLRKRFLSAGIVHYKSLIADVASKGFSMTQKFDIVICDAPCSGSGTWSRTPEQLLFFEKEKIETYAGLQKKISVNASKSVKPGGYFLYITCSVFSMENEEVVDYILQNTSLLLLSSEYLKGYDKKADTLFTALFRL
jgi:16S rRNA (cytosine967-C5)-methyltransferase